MIRNHEDYGYQEVTTEIETAHRIARGERHVVEFVIQQSVYKVTTKKHAPRKLFTFCLSPDDAETMARELIEHARAARKG